MVQPLQDFFCGILAVVPALFPFMVLSSVPLWLRWDSLLAHAAIYGGFPFLRAVSRRMVCSSTGLLCGCPMGAKRVGLSGGRAAPAPARQIFSFCTHPRSPMFLAGSSIPCLPLNHCFLCLSFAIYIAAPAARYPGTLHLSRSLSPESIPENSGIPNNIQLRIPPMRFLLKYHDQIMSSSALSLDARDPEFRRDSFVKIGGYLIFIPF